ncbi:uncharacterized protein LOC122665592 [Telopea speciosissima]|uniref:uncharacterized protein LOC122665592 n=1 Tax=Telopea speciosissima TaxID=54955 RepID=UPI001CC760A8|nr:uncharacterized protein LOC122665592 [Telopea speciosissima]
MHIWQDKSSGNWWFVTEDKIQVGYWANEIMYAMGNGAGILRYGGFAIGTAEGPSPPMGNGHFAGHEYREIAYFARIKYVDDSRTPKDIFGDMGEALADATECYTIQYWGNQGSYMGQTFTYGGPGGNDCGD